jgi:hypothetical protein
LREASAEAAEEAFKFSSETETGVRQLQFFNSGLTRVNIALRKAEESSENLSNIFEASANAVTNFKQAVDIAIAAASVAARLRDIQIQRETRERALELELAIPGETVTGVESIVKGLAQAQTLAQAFTSTIADAGTFERFAIISEAVRELAAGRTDAKRVFDVFQVGSSVVERLREEQERINAQIENQANLIDTLKRPQEELTKFAADYASKLKEGAKNIDQSLASNQQLVGQLSNINDILRDTEERNKVIRSIEKNRDTLRQEAVRLNEALNQQITKEKDQLIEVVKSVEQAVGGFDELNLSVQKEVKSIGQQIGLLGRQKTDLAELLELRKASGSALDEIEILERRIQRTNEEQVRQVQERQRNTLDLLTTLKEVAEVQRDFETAARLEGVIARLQASFDEQITKTRERLKLEGEIEIRERAFTELQNLENKLADIRITQARQVLEEEQRLAQRRAEFIMQFADTPIFSEVLRKELGQVPAQARRIFGAIRAIILREQTRSAELAVQPILNEFAELSEKGAKDIERLAFLQENRNKVVQTIEEDVGRRREAILDRVKEITNRVSESEKTLVDERNKLPALNQRVIESQRRLSDANIQVRNATRSLFEAFQNAADATARFRFDLLRSAVDIQRQTGALGSVRDQVTALIGIFTTVTNEIRTSEEATLDLRRQIAQETLSIFQNQFNAIRDLGVRSATATTDNLLELQRGLGVAARIAETGEIGGFTPEDLASALDLRSIFPEITRIISEAGLRRIGIDPAVLENVEDQMVRLAEITAEANRTQVNAAFQQVALAREQLIKAEESRKQAEQQVQIAAEQRELQIRRIAQAGIGLTVNREMLAQTSSDAARQIERLTDISNSSKVMADVLRTIDSNIVKLTTSVDRQTARLGTIAGVPTAAGGTLSSGELLGLLSAAQREKRAMPPGSQLMLANTSEVVLTRRQAKMIGLQPRSQPNAVDGNVNAAVLESAVNNLSTLVAALFTKINDPGFINQNISVQVDSERTINVRGLDAVDTAVRRAFEDQMGRVATREEQDAVGNIVSNIIQRLHEQGIVDSRGI